MYTYDLSREKLESAMLSFEHDAKDYIESMGWTYTPQHQIVANNELDYESEDIDIIMSSKDEDSLTDAITNMVAEKIISAIEKLD